MSVVDERRLRRCRQSRSRGGNSREAPSIDDEESREGRAAIGQGVERREFAA